MKKIYFLICFLYFHISAHAHLELVHKYLVAQGWELVKIQFPGSNWSAMDYSIGDWQNNNINQPSWVHGKVMTGVWMEDNYDPIWHITWPAPSNTHFWQAEPDNGSCWVGGGSGITIAGGCYENANVKIHDYWNGHIYQGFPPQWGNYLLQIGAQVISGPGMTPGYKNLSLLYDDLSNVYTINFIWVRGYSDTQWPYWHPYTYPYPLLTAFNIQNGTRPLIERICWEIVGRMCHLIQDSGVPTHAHNDTHWCGYDCDWFESGYMAPPHNHYLDRDYHSAIDQANLFGQSPVVPPWNDIDPLHYLMYTTNQIADRFASNDANGNTNYISIGEHGEDYGHYIAPLYNTITVPVNQLDVYSLEQCRNTSYVFSMRTTAGFLHWIYQRFNIQSTPPPVISGFHQTPALLCRGNIGVVRCNLSQGGGVTYTWWDQGRPIGMSIAYEGNQATLFYGIDRPEGGAKPAGGDDLPFKLFCTASNNYGSSTQEFRPVWSPGTCPGSGCPWLYVFNQDSGGYSEDNNILHRSEFPEFAGQDIKDLYKLQISPSPIDNTFSIALKESETDTNYYDNVKLLAVDHPVGTGIGITENNDIVMYDTSSVVSTDNATLNDTTNITNFIQYYYHGKKIVSGDNGDSIYAHYDSSGQMRAFNLVEKKYGRGLSSLGDSVALVGEIGGDIIDPINKNYAGDVTIYTGTTTISKLFARRENLSPVIIPFAENSETVDHIDINWYEPYQVTYFSVVPIMYNGFQVTELPILDATHSDEGQVIVQLLGIDSNYISSDSSNVIVINFSDINAPEPGMVRDYVIDLFGKYTHQGTSNNPNPKVTLSNPSVPRDYKLYNNFPNPFNPKTTIKYSLAEDGLVKLSVYDILGRLVKVVVNDFQLSGTHSVQFDGTDLASGLYLYRIESKDFVESKKMLLLK